MGALLKSTYCSVLLKWEFFIKMRASYLQPSSLHYSSFFKEGGSKAGSSHFDDKFSFYKDTTVGQIMHSIVHQNRLR